MDSSNINKTRNLTICRFYGTNNTVPELRLRGKWLREAGFESGQVVTITCNNKELIINTDGIYKYPRETKS